MSGIQQSDIFIQTAISLSVEDLRKNPFLIEHMLSGLKKNKYVWEKYGQKQVDACKEWIVNNNIEVSLRPRNDRDNPPCITISLDTSNEKSEMKTMGDQSPYSVMLLPNDIGKPIPFITKPFIPESYNETTGVLGVPATIDLNQVSPGMILVNPANSNGFVIKDLVPNGLQLELGLEIDASQLAIVPHYQYYKARVEHTWNEESYIIACNALDPQTTIWLWSIAKYALFRYRESLLEANGMYESVLASGGGPDQDTAWTTQGGEKIYSRVLKLTCQTEDTWLKEPHRIIEAVAFTPTKTCKGITGGIKIISNNNTPSFIENEAEQLWTTIDD